MFTNIEELRELIRQGKSNEEIIKGRLKYLNSVEYKQNKRTERIQGEDQVYYHEGFIGEDLLIAADGGRCFTNLYMADEMSVYGDLINSVRENMDKTKNIPIRVVLKKVYEYFKFSEDSQYKGILEYINENRKVLGVRYARNNLPCIIQFFKNSKFTGSFTKFAQLYIMHDRGSEKYKEEHKQELEDWRKSIDWEKVDEDPILKLSELKGTGIAMCTEKNMALQNCLTFMGYDSYFLGGKLIDENKSEQHNFVVVKGSTGQFCIIDAAQYLVHPIQDITSPEDLKYLKNIKAQNGYKQDVYYFSHLADKEDILIK